MVVPEKFKNIVHIDNLTQLGLNIKFWEDIRVIKDIPTGKSHSFKSNYMKCDDFLQKINLLEDFIQMTIGSKQGNVFNSNVRSSKEQNQEIQSRYKYDISNHYN